MRKVIQNFRVAYSGLAYTARGFNTKLLLAITCAVIPLSFLLKLCALEMAVVALTITVVFAAEFFNTSVERLSDFVEPKYDRAIKAVKDTALAGVAVACIGAFFVGILVFLPKVIAVFGGD